MQSVRFLALTLGLTVSRALRPTQMAAFELSTANAFQRTLEDLENMDGAEDLFEEAYWNADLNVAPRKPQPSHHYFWEFDFNKAVTRDTLACFFMLLLSGVLCSAGGIGGGGIYVTVLMVAGKLGVHDAIPLSKAVVFVGSLCTLALNLSKSLGVTGTQARRSLIDYNIVRLVVPASLVGTYLGVVLNSILGEGVILTVLITILSTMTWSVGWQAYAQYQEEQLRLGEAAQRCEEQGPAACEEDPSLMEKSPSPAGYERAPKKDSPSEEETSSPTAGSDGKKSSSLRAGQTQPSKKALQGLAEEQVAADPTGATTVSAKDIAMILGLVVVVGSGITQFHARACHEALHCDGGTTATVACPVMRDVGTDCHHPIFSFLEHRGGLEEFMRSSGEIILLATVAVPVMVCATVAILSTLQCTQVGGWGLRTALSYEAMAMVTGCLAGLVGIGGGLIFCPFFLMMGVDPAIAVATSSTCVIFTSTSTTLQYVFTDRIIMALAIIYGAANLIASYAGTKVVHYLQDHFAERKSFITSIVFAGVSASVVLSVTKFFESG